MYQFLEIMGFDAQTVDCISFVVSTIMINAMLTNFSITSLTFTCSKSTIETVKKVKNCSKLAIRTPEQRH